MGPSRQGFRVLWHDPAMKTVFEAFEPMPIVGTKLARQAVAEVFDKN